MKKQVMQKVLSFILAVVMVMGVITTVPMTVMGAEDSTWEDEVRIINSIITKYELNIPLYTNYSTSWPPPAQWDKIVRYRNYYGSGYFIEELYLSNMNITGPLDVSGLTHLVSLKISNNEITSLTLPYRTHEYYYLGYLDCNNNELTELPKLPDKLDHLECSSNKLTELPKLPDNLRYLGCSNNALKVLPSLPSGLVWLYCSNTQIEKLPNLPETLTQLYCSKNNIAYLPTLPDSLYELDVTSNALTRLPTLPPLISYLRCGNNKLTEIPNLRNDYMLALYCNDNQLEKLPKLPDKMGTFHCSNNLLTEIPNIPDDLENFYCYSNKLTELPSLENTKLKELDCRWNQLKSLPELPSSLWTLYCQNNQLTSLPVLPSKLDTINCSSNQLTELPILPSSLWSLDCSLNALTKLPDILPSSLWFLNCNFNQLTELPYLSNLSSLSCSYNNLTSIDVSNAKRLYSLSCKNNPIEHLKLSGEYEMNVVRRPQDGGTVMLTEYNDWRNNYVKLTAIPAEGYIFDEWSWSELIPGAVVDNDSVAFNLPPNSMTVYADFEEIDFLDSISVTTKPDKISYKQGESLDLAGMIVTATYSNGHQSRQKTVTGYDTNPANGSELWTMGKNTITVSYSSGGITRTDSFIIEVRPSEPYLNIVNVEGGEYYLNSTKSGSYPPGTQIECIFSAKQGYIFEGWEVSGAEFIKGEFIGAIDGYKLPMIYFVMPNNDVTVEPVVRRESYYYSRHAMSDGKIDVGGTVSGTPGGQINVGATITANAEAGLDYKFDKWTVKDVNGNILNPDFLIGKESLPTISFKMPEYDVYLYANFKVDDKPLEFEISIYPDPMRWGLYDYEESHLYESAEFLKALINLASNCETVVELALLVSGLIPPTAIAVFSIIIIGTAVEQSLEYIVDQITALLLICESYIYNDQIWTSPTKLYIRYKNPNQTSRYGVLNITLPSDMCFGPTVNVIYPGASVSKNGKTLTLPVYQYSPTGDGWIPISGSSNSLGYGLSIYPTKESFNYDYDEELEYPSNILSSFKYNDIYIQGNTKTIYSTSTVNILKEKYTIGSKPPEFLYDKMYASFACPVDLLIYDSNGELLAKVANYDENVVEIDGLVAYADGETKYISIPHDKLADFRIKLAATDDGTMDVLAYDFIGGDISSLTMFNEVPLTKGDIFETEMKDGLFRLFKTENGEPSNATEINFDVHMKIVTNGDGTQTVWFTYFENGEIKTDSMTVNVKTPVDPPKDDKSKKENGNSGALTPPPPIISIANPDSGSNMIIAVPPESAAVIPAGSTAPLTAEQPAETVNKNDPTDEPPTVKPAAETQSEAAKPYISDSREDTAVSLPDTETAKPQNSGAPAEESYEGPAAAAAAESGETIRENAAPLAGFTPDATATIAERSAEPEPQKDNPKTGDNIAIFALVILFAALALGKKKKRGNDIYENK